MYKFIRKVCTINFVQIKIMKEIDNEILEEASRYTLTNSMLISLLNNLRDSIIKNSNLIIDANKEDVKHNKKQIKIKELIEIIENYRNNDCILNDDERKIVIYKGDPYLTLHLCLQSITQRTKLLLIYEQFMLGVNEILLKIINDILNEYKIFNLIHKFDTFSLKELNKIKNFYDEIVVIGDTTVYQMLQDEKIKFYPYNNIALFCESEELEKLQEAIYIYAVENEFEIEILYDSTLGEVIDIINSDDYKNIAILLTKNEDSKEKFIKEIKDKQIFVNDNPFKNEVGKIYNYLK